MAPIYPTGPGTVSGVSRQVWVRNVFWSMLALSVVAIIIRLRRKLLSRPKIEQDEYTIILSLVTTVVVGALGYKMIYQQGLGLHSWELERGQLAQLARYLFVTRILCNWTNCLTKLSLLLFYYRIFHIYPVYRRIALIIGLSVVSWTLAMTFIFVFECVPVTTSWKSYWALDTKAHCSNSLSVDWPVNTVSSLCTDLAIVILPVSQLKQIWHLQCKVAYKGLTTGMFILGLAYVSRTTMKAIGISAHRLYLIFSYEQTDPTFTVAPIWIWAQIENATRLLSACLPASGHVFQYIPRKMIALYNASCSAEKGTVSSSSLGKSPWPTQSRQFAYAAPPKTASKRGPESPTFSIESIRSRQGFATGPRPPHPNSLSAISDDESDDCRGTDGDMEESVIGFMKSNEVAEPFPSHLRDADSITAEFPWDPLDQPA